MDMALYCDQGPCTCAMSSHIAERAEHEACRSAWTWPYTATMAPAHVPCPLTLQSVQSMRCEKEGTLHSMRVHPLHGASQFQVVGCASFAATRKTQGIFTRDATRMPFMVWMWR